MDSVLADPECKFTSQLKINYDLIEVSEGWCFSSSKRKFVQNPIREIEKESPRACVEYQHTKTPDSKYFVNSSAANQSFKARLLKDMKKVIEILANPHCKVIRPLCVDNNLIEVNEGQCWSNKERRFLENAIKDKDISHITPQAFSPYDPTKVLDPKYFREILENSLTEAKAQTKLEFKPEDQPAMDRRLKNYTFKSLPNLRKKATEWFKRHPMECVAWAATKARPSSDQVESLDNSEDE
ncbi:hypothetical protein ACROYT_G006358 [Oculina patagonica]